MPPPRWDPSRPRPAKWGVDSQKRSDLLVTWDGAEMTFFEYVEARIGRRPEFWGRYIGSGAGTRKTNRLDGSEVEFLHRRSCKVALVYNGLRMRPGTHSRSEHLDGFSNGLWTARNAVRSAEALDPPPPSGVRIYVDIENWYVDHHWFRGWYEGMSRTRFAGAGGLYGRAGHAARDRRQLRGGAVDTTSEEFRSGYPSSHWSRAATRAGRRMDRRQDDLEAGTAAYRRLSRYVWSNDPRHFGDPLTIDQLFPPRFVPADVPGGARSVVWQYCLQCYIDSTGGGGPIDINYALDAAFSEMW